MELSLTEVGNAIQAVGDFERFKDVTISRVRTDSRSVQPGDLFVCISGKRFDGHEFAREAVHKGAVAIIVQRPLDDISPDVPLLLVQDSINALANLAIYCRNSFRGYVVAITGTAGKTTIKDWLASTLRPYFKVGKNYKNWNNRLGVSLSILEFDWREDFWILEAGISEENEMDELAMIIRPDMAVVNNVGSAHLQGLGDVAGVAREKMKILNYMQEQGKIILNASYSWLKDYFSGSHDPEIVFFSTRDRNMQFFGQSLQSLPGGKAKYQLQLAGETVELSGCQEAEFILENLLAVATTASVLGMKGREIEKGVQEAKSQTQRWDIEQIGAITIIDDTYNANPVSMQSALQALLNIAENEPVFLLLGDMKELGEYAQDEHVKLGREIGRMQVESVFYFGSYAAELEKGISRSENPVHVTRVQDAKDFLLQWKKKDPQKGVLLAKGSRGCELEKFVWALQAELRK